MHRYIRSNYIDSNFHEVIKLFQRKKKVFFWYMLCTGSGLCCALERDYVVCWEGTMLCAGRGLCCVLGSGSTLFAKCACLDSPLFILRPSMFHHPFPSLLCFTIHFQASCVSPSIPTPPIFTSHFHTSYVSPPISSSPLIHRSFPVLLCFNSHSQSSCFSSPISWSSLWKLITQELLQTDIIISSLKDNDVKTHFSFLLNAK